MVYVQPPGGFSFTGLSDILKEFRELLKDVWYRNNFEMRLAVMDVNLN